MFLSLHEFSILQRKMVMWQTLHREEKVRIPVLRTRYVILLYFFGLLGTNFTWSVEISFALPLICNNLDCTTTFVLKNIRQVILLCGPPGTGKVTIVIYNFICRQCMLNYNINLISVWPLAWQYWHSAAMSFNACRTFIIFFLTFYHSHT